MKSISRPLLEWYRRNRRPLPWRQSPDAYRVWISEIMLQQTRVAAVIPYYQRFLDRFPTPEALAAAPEAELLQAWAGLGYYSRARNLQKAARQIVEAGSFPGTYDQIRRLPGVGDYTAAAIASIAYHLPHAVLDGNVLRVMARLTDDDGDIRLPAVRARLLDTAQRHLDPADPGDYNQGLMELGATLCLPGEPQCLLCPLASACAARKSGRQRRLPVKSKGPSTLRETRTLFLIERPGEILLWQRPATSARLAGFWELPEAEQAPSAEPGEPLCAFSHSIVSHRYRFELRRAALAHTPPACHWVSLDALSALPLSTVARKALRPA